MKEQAPQSGDLGREASSWNSIDLALVAGRFADEDVARLEIGDHMDVTYTWADG